MANLFRVYAEIGIGGTGLVTLNPQVPNASYEAGDLVTVSVIPNAGFSFVEWTEFGVEFVSASSSFVFTVPTKDTYLLATLTVIMILFMIMDLNISFNIKFLDLIQTQD